MSNTIIFSNFFALPSFDLLFYLKSIFIVFAVLKCLEVIISAIRKKAHGEAFSNQSL